MKKQKTIILAVLLLAACIQAQSLIPIGVNYGGLSHDGSWYSKAAIPNDDGSVVFIGMNPNAADYAAVLKYSLGKVSTVRPGYVDILMIRSSNNSWLLKQLGKTGLFATVSCFNQEPQFHVSDNSAIWGSLGTGIPFDTGRLGMESGFDGLRLASSGNGGKVLAQAGNQDLVVFTRNGNDWEKIIVPKNILGDFTPDNQRGLALDFEGRTLWHFQMKNDGYWLVRTDISGTYENWTENSQYLYCVDTENHSYQVVCSEDGSVVYFNAYVNNVSVIMKGVYADGAMNVQAVSFANGNLANDDCFDIDCSFDGRFAVYASKATNLTDDRILSSTRQIYRYDSWAQANMLISKLDGKLSNGDCMVPGISRSGKYVTFTTAATNLGNADTRPKLILATCTVPDNKGLIANTSAIGCLGVSDDGSRVLFSTTDRLSSDDTSNNAKYSVYEHDLNLGITWLVSPNDLDNYRKCAISGNGQVVAYTAEKGMYIVWNGQKLDGIGNVYALSLNHDGSVLAVNSNGTVKIFNKGESPVVVTEQASKLDGAKNSVWLDYDGKVMIYTKDNGLYAYYAENKKTVQMTTEGVFDAMLTQGGHWAFYHTAADMLYKKDCLHSAEPCLSGSMFACSGNGRVAFKADLTANKLTCYALPGNTKIADVGDCAGTNYRCFRASFTGTRVFYVNDGALRYQELKIAEAVPALQGTGGISENTGTLKAYEITLKDKNQTDYAIRLPDGTTAQGNKVELLHADGLREWGALSYTPRKYFCGYDTVVVECWDGTQWKTQTINLEVENVNNPPVAKETSVTVAENQSKTVDFSVVDEDMAYSDYTHETLNFKLKDAPGWAKVQNGKLVLNLSGIYDLAQRGANGKVEMKYSVTDKVGASASGSVMVTVTNTNRAPVIGAAGVYCGDGEPVAWNAFKVSDADAEDTDSTLQLVFTASSSGVLKDKQGKTVTAGEGVLKSRFPLSYSLKPGAKVLEDTFTVYALDGDKAHSNSVVLTIKTEYWQKTTGELYGGYLDENRKVHWTGLQKGWNLLSVPYVVENMKAYKAALGLEVIWKWKDGRYVEADSLDSDEGFWGYIESLPQNLNCIVEGIKEKGTLKTGWSLRGDYGARLSGTVMGLQDGIYMPQTAPTAGKGYWVYQP